MPVRAPAAGCQGQALGSPQDRGFQGDRAALSGERRQSRKAMEDRTLNSTSLSDLYRAYIACLNAQSWDELGRYVDDAVEHNGRLLRLSGYREMLVQDFADIPDLRFEIQLLAISPPIVAARLAFRCSPRAKFLGLSVEGRTVSFAENVFYEFKGGKIALVWSVIDKAAIEAQLSA